MTNQKKLELKIYVDSKNGKVLKTYKLNKVGFTKIQCSEGHIWKVRINSIVNNRTWCPNCFNLRRGSMQWKYTVKDMQNFALRAGGPGSKFLDKKFRGVDRKYTWYCSKHGVFFKRGAAVISMRSWCLKCSYEKRASSYPKRLNINAARLLAKENNGKCLSIVYKNSSQKLEWQCENGHTWSASISVIKKGHWCSICRMGSGERICREILSIVFNTNFKKIRPLWLKNPTTNFPLELDGFSEELKIAFEYDGDQHYGIIGFYSSDKRKFKSLRRRDAYKEKILKLKNIKLIRIRQVKNVGDLNQIKKSIINGLIKQDFRKEIKLVSKLDYNDINTKLVANKNLSKEASVIIKKKMGSSNFKNILSASQKLSIVCAQKHEFYKNLTQLRADEWCSTCANLASHAKRRSSISNVIKISKLNGFEYVDDFYNNAREPHQFRCLKCSFVKTSSYDGVRSGRGCPKCIGNLKGTIQKMSEFATKKGGKCLSKKYKGAHVKLEWQCRNLHRWKTTPNSIINGKSWCKYCRKLSSK